MAFMVVGVGETIFSPTSIYPMDQIVVYFRRIRFHLHILSIRIFLVCLTFCTQFSAS